MKKVTACFLFCLAATWPALAAPTVEELLAKGSASVQKKDYKSAAKTYEQALAAKPGDPKLHTLLGLTYGQLGDFDRAVEHSQAAVAKEPSFAAYHNLGLIFANKGEYGKAKNAYEAALAMNPTAYRAWYQLGLLHVQHGEFKAGIDAYVKSVSLNKMFGKAYLGLGSAYYWSGDKTKAREQVAALKQVGLTNEAGQLEYWLEKKEKPAEKPAAAPAAATPPAPSSK